MRCCLAVGRLGCRLLSTTSTVPASCRTCFNSNIYFLLGKSRRNGRLVTFSGKNGAFDATQRDTAAREFHEETLGAVVDRSTMLTMLHRCNIVLESTTPRGQPCYTHVVEIPFRKHYTLCFMKTRCFLEAIRGARVRDVRHQVGVRAPCSVRYASNGRGSNLTSPTECQAGAALSAVARGCDELACHSGGGRRRRRRQRGGRRARHVARYG